MTIIEPYKIYMINGILIFMIGFTLIHYSKIWNLNDEWFFCISLIGLGTFALGVVIQ